MMLAEPGDFAGVEPSGLGVVSSNCCVATAGIAGLPLLRSRLSVRATLRGPVSGECAPCVCISELIIPKKPRQLRTLACLFRVRVIARVNRDTRVTDHPRAILGEIHRLHLLACGSQY